MQGKFPVNMDQFLILQAFGLGYNEVGLMVGFHSIIDFSLNSLHQIFVAQRQINVLGDCIPAAVSRLGLHNCPELRLTTFF